MAMTHCQTSLDGWRAFEPASHLERGERGAVRLLGRGERGAQPLELGLGRRDLRA